MWTNISMEPHLYGAPAKSTGQVRTSIRRWLSLANLLDRQQPMELEVFEPAIRKPCHSVSERTPGIDERSHSRDGELEVVFIAAEY